MKASNNLFFPVFICLLFLCGCNRENIVFLEYHHIPDQSWNDDHVLNYHPTISNAVSPCNLWIELRHNDNYPYQNIWFFVTILHNNRVLQTDTLQYMLANDFGKWQGRGYNTFYQQTLIYKNVYQFPDTGKFDIRIQHAMRDSNLKGVEDIGLRIEQLSVNSEQ